MVKPSRKKDGQRRSTGGPDLRGTQAYPVGFGAMLALEYHTLLLRFTEEGFPVAATADGTDCEEEPLSDDDSDADCFEDLKQGQRVWSSGFVSA